MANVFDQFAVEDPKKKKRDAAVHSVFDQFDPVEVPPMPELSFGRSPDDPWYEKAGRFGLDTAKSFNDTISMGLYPKLLDLTGIQPGSEAAVQEIKDNDPWASVAGQTTGMMLPGMMISNGLAASFPMFARNTLKSIGMREGLTNGLLSATDDVVRTGEIDPYGVAVDTAAGGILGPLVSIGSRAISPAARVRAMGDNLMPWDKQVAYDFAKQSEAAGIPLNSSEAIEATVPAKGKDVLAEYNLAATSPKGSQVAAAFDASRTPSIKEAGKRLVMDIGPGIKPQEAATVANLGIGRNQDLVRTSSKPYYDSSATKKAPPTWLGRSVSAKEAAAAVLNSPEKMAALNAEYKALVPSHKGPIPTNVGLFQDAVKKQLDFMIAEAEKDAHLQSIRMGAASGLTDVMDSVAPDYSMARSISEQGKGMVDELMTGPLGRVAQNPGNTQAQAQALFNPGTDIDRIAAERAIKELDATRPGTSQGIFANMIDQSVNSSPLGWGKTAIPTDHSASAVGVAIGNKNADLARTVEAARAVRPATGTPSGAHDGGWLDNEIYRAIRDYGRDGVVKLLQDPEWIKKMGGIGPVQQAVNRVFNSAAMTASDRNEIN